MSLVIPYQFNISNQLFSTWEVG